MTQIIRSTRSVEEPPFEPVSLVTAKLHCKVEDTDDDDLFTDILIPAARARAEELTGRAFVPHVFELVMDQFPASDEPIELLYSPLVSVESVTYTDAAGDLHTIDAADLVIDTRGLPGSIAPASGWPSSSGHRGSIVIRYTGGYMPDASPIEEADYQAAVPATVRNWILLRVETFYDNRANLDMANLTALPRDFVDGLLDGLVLNIGAA